MKLSNLGINLFEQKKVLTEAPIPDDWDKEKFKNVSKDTIKDMIEYATNKSQYLGDGDDRIAFLIPYQNRDTVLKVAKKATGGKTQNAIEVKHLSNEQIKPYDITIPIIDWDKDNKVPMWIHMEYAKQLTAEDYKKHFMGLSQVESYLNDDYEDYSLRHSLQIQKDMRKINLIKAQLQVIKPEYTEKIESLKKELEILENDDKTPNIDSIIKEKYSFLYKLKKFYKEYMIPNNLVDDFHFANFGWFNNKIVIIDLGYVKKQPKLHKIKGDK